MFDRVSGEVALSPSNISIRSKGQRRKTRLRAGAIMAAAIAGLGLFTVPGEAAQWVSAPVSNIRSNATNWGDTLPFAGDLLTFASPGFEEVPMD